MPRAEAIIAVFIGVYCVVLAIETISLKVSPVFMLMAMIYFIGAILLDEPRSKNL